MKHIILARHIKIEGMDFPINANPERRQGCYREILERTHDQFSACLSYHSALTVVRMDFHLHAYTDDNRVMSQFLHKLNKRLLREYSNFKRLGYVWAREMEKADQQHYHIALMVDRHVIQHPGRLIRICEELWQSLGQPKPYTPKNCYYTVRRSDTESFREAFFRVSYFAKVRGKGCKASTANDFSSSRLKRKLI